MSQYAMINFWKSDSALSTSAIPQRSVLDPLLFVICKIDLSDSVESNVYLCIDGAKIYNSINSVNEHDILQHDIDNLIKWSSDWIFLLPLIN